MTRTRRALAFWGPETVRLIQQSTKVELLVLEPTAAVVSDDQSDDFLLFGGKKWQIVERADLSRARGLVHARHALTDDASFESESTAASSNESQWSHAVRFGDANGSATVLMDFSARRFANFDTGREVSVIAKIASGWQTFVERHAPLQAKKRE